jgi:hypothetical protein
MRLIGNKISCQERQNERCLFFFFFFFFFSLSSLSHSTGIKRYKGYDNVTKDKGKVIAT